MGNICSISLSADRIVYSFWDGTTEHANYLRKLPENLVELGTACERLREFRNDVKRKVDIAEREQMQRLDQVQGWLSRVENLESQVSQLIEDGTEEIEKKCLGGCCPRRCSTGYKLGKRVARKLKEVDTLMSQRPLDLVAERLPSPRVGERPSEATVGMNSRLGMVWSSLDEEQVGIIGLYGLGGVGKTTLLTQINNAFTKTTHDFDFVIWATVSRNVNLGKIQDDIWKKIGFCDDRWKSKDRDEKATSIWNVLTGKRFVLLLDDVWERLTLLDVGVPLQNKKNKIVFTTRSEEVCAQMEADKRIKVDCLTRTESWDLFRMKLGEDALNFHPDIPKLAQVVAQECCGLPLVLTTMGKAMACKKTPQEWKHAIRVFQSSASKLPGMGDRVFPLLKYSYDCLPTEVARSCFLYCSLYPEDYAMSKSSLINRWICEGFLDEFDDWEGAENQGYNIIGTLIHACLLEEADVDYQVKLHDVIRDMALWIARETGKEQDKFLVKAGSTLTEAPEVAEWMGPKRISLMNNQIEKLTGSPICPNLSTLFLRENSLKMITDSFFRFMPNLRVLDLSDNSITELPRGISNLVSLRYLDLSLTEIKELPIELKNLGNLKCLVLSDMPQLSSIPEQLISSLLMLQAIDMFDCGICDGDEALVEELESLKYLHVLGVTITSTSAFKRLLSSDKLRSCISKVCLRNFNGSSSFNITSLGNVKRLIALSISKCGSLEDLEIDWVGEGKKTVESNYLNSKVSSHNSFHSLKVVAIESCSRLKDLTWLVFAPNLNLLKIKDCDQMQEVIGTGKCGESAENGENLSPFVKLQALVLDDLPQLKSIFWKALPFIYLNTIIVDSCPLLKKLPLNANSAKGRRIVISGQTEWWNEVEWEDEATHNAFLPCFVPIKE
ncbi:disease resistance protein SUMM2-like [Vitis riparia]|uniref:disease resistance protein SUMM2-like n=1 Tax=Vitis riparia TaxID=96939 RepID=UPI00155B28B2|nr:disease resistance protein SUMM2-like [Vitis riparia]XP_034696377.1 disease resistance protein SUMM2-like [Vitis riparia]